jgi:hypothetical protein
MSADDPLVRARAALATGDVDAVAAAYDGITPASPDAFEWLLLLVEAGHLERARKLTSLLRGDEADKAASLLSDEPPWDEDDDADSPFTVAEATSRTTPDGDRDTLESFLRWFGGRRDLYSRAWVDERRHRSGYRPVEEPLTVEVARAHVRGAITVGQYLLFPDGTCSFGVIDLDVSASVMDALRAGHGAAVSPLLHAPLRSFALRLIDSASRLGLPMVAEDSGGRGVHLWLHLEPRRLASAVRAALSQIVTGAGPVPPDVGVEIFPKQDRLGPRGLSSLVKLPLGYHPVTFRRCWLLDDQLRPIEDLRQCLAAVRVAPPDVVEAVVGRRVVPLPAPELGPVAKVPPLSEQRSARSLAELLRSVQAGDDEHRACEQVLRGCAVLRALVEKAYERHALEAEEARAMVYSIGLVGPGPGLIDEVLAAARVPRRELDRVRKGLPNPVGCKRLHALAPAGTVCGCFGRDALPYPTPLLHAVGPVAPAEPRWKPFAAHLGADEGVVQGPLDAIGEALSRIERRLEELERGRGEG